MKKEMNVWQRLQRNQTAFILLVLCCLLGGCSARAGAPKSKVFKFRKLIENLLLGI